MIHLAHIQGVRAWVHQHDQNNERLSSMKNIRFLMRLIEMTCSFLVVREPATAPTQAAKKVQDPGYLG